MAITRRSIYSSLCVQLAMMGASQDHYLDLINDYMKLWDIKKNLAKDIKLRGVVYEDYSSVGVKIKKSNPSTKELVMVSRQMLSILEKLGLTTANVCDGDEDDL